VYEPNSSHLVAANGKMFDCTSGDGEDADELFIARGLRSGLTSQADDPNRLQMPVCLACAQEPQRHPTGGRMRLVSDRGVWTIPSAAGR
jgi:hypothetical protein